MNVPPFNEIRAGEFADERMEQVRELLFGDSVRVLEARIRLLETRIEEVDGVIGRKLDAIEARIQALSGSAETDRRASFEALARSIAELGEQVRRISRG